jgi:hypothetical protein
MAKTEEQQLLFENPPAWTEHWGGMPEFEQKNELPYDSINVQFKNAEDRRSFFYYWGRTQPGASQSGIHRSATLR